MSKSLKLPPVKNRAGDLLSDVEVKELVHSTPLVVFEVGELTFAAQVDPMKVTGAHNNHIEATQRRLRGLFDRPGPEDGNESKDALLARAEANKAFDAEAFEAAYNAFDTARAERAVAATVAWNHPLPCDVETLTNNALLGDAYLAAWNDWWQDFTQGSRAGGTTTTDNSATLTTTTTNPPGADAATPPSDASKG